MSHRIFVAAFALLMCLGINSFAQDKTVSPSDIPVDQIKNAAQIKAEQEKAAKAAAAKKAADAKAAAKPADVKPNATTDAKLSAKPNDEKMKESIAPVPAAEGTVVEGSLVAEPGCGCDATPAPCGTCEPACDPCSGRGKFMSRIRSMFKRCR